MEPFRGEKGSTWEGGFRVPALIRWPGVVKPGTVINDIFSHQDWLPTLLAAAGEPRISDKLKKGHRAGPRQSFYFPRMVHLRSDPYETSLDSGLYTRFFADQLWLFVPVQQEVGKWLLTFRQFPPRQPTASFTIDRMMQQMLQARATGTAAATGQGARP